MITAVLTFLGLNGALLFVLSWGWNEKYNRPRDLLDGFDRLLAVYGFAYLLARTLAMLLAETLLTAVYFSLAAGRHLLNGALIMAQVCLPKGSELRKRIGIPLLLSGLLVVTLRLLGAAIGVRVFLYDLLLIVVYIALAKVYFDLAWRRT